MPKFLSNNKILEEISNLLIKAKRKIVIISPYIKLNTDLRAILKNKSTSEKLELIVVFGKNKDNITKSLSEKDFKLFKLFYNVKIYYIENLHAKYYANEKHQIITSKNLYTSKSGDNIEIGILTEHDILSNLSSRIFDLEKSFGKNAWDYFFKSCLNRDPSFEKKYNKKRIKLLNNKLDPVTLIDELTKEYENLGYCIRTGVRIPFNTDMPYSVDSFKIWAKFKNPDYKENFCHKTGRNVPGGTSFKNPILIDITQLNL